MKENPSSFLGKDEGFVLNLVFELALLKTSLLRVGAAWGLLREWEQAWRLASGAVQLYLEQLDAQNLAFLHHYSRETFLPELGEAAQTC
jgi:hypothetical protein